MTTTDPWIVNWLQGGPADDWRIESMVELPDEILMLKDPFKPGWIRVIGPWPEAIVYERVRDVEQIDREHIYYPTAR